MDKKFINLDKQKNFFKIFNIVCIGVLSSVSIFVLFFKMLPKRFVNVCFYMWVAFLVFYLISDIIFYLKIRQNTKDAFKSKYLFDRNLVIDNIETKFKDCILQEVEFFEDGFLLNGLKTSYDEVNIEFSVYGDNIMFHIYIKEEEVNPLLVFIVTEEMYYMIKKFNLNINLLNKEIDLLNIQRGI